MTRKEILAVAKPILFNTEMIRAILEDRKTVTRRPIKLKYSNTHIQWHKDKYGKCLVEMQNDVEGETYGVREDGTHWHHLLAMRELKPPYKVGDILYVRETWCKYSCLEDDLASPIADTEKYYYRADGENPTPFNRFLVQKKGYDEYSDYPLWRPSIHMPKEAARIFLRVTGVRVERLQDITDEQALQEGFSSRAKFISAFLKMYPKCTVDSWVWVIEFEKVEFEKVDDPSEWTIII